MVHLYLLDQDVSKLDFPIEMRASERVLNIFFSWSKKQTIRNYTNLIRICLNQTFQYYEGEGHLILENTDNITYWSIGNGTFWQCRGHFRLKILTSVSVDAGALLT